MASRVIPKRTDRACKREKVYDKYPFYFGERQVDDMMSMVADDMNLKVRETPKKHCQHCLRISRVS